MQKKRINQPSDGLALVDPAAAAGTVYLDGIHRIKWELLFFILNLAAIGLLPLLKLVMISKGLEDLFFKALLVNAGALHAHVMRKAFFPYIDFANETENYNKIMVIALYVTVIFSYARGG